MRRALALIAAAFLLLAAVGVGCGGSGEDDESSGAAPEGELTLEELWRAPGDDVTFLPGTASHEPGKVRVSFVVIDAAGRPVTIPTARVWLARDLKSRPFLATSAKIERIGVPGGAEADATHIYVANVSLDEPDTYWLLAEPEGGRKVQAIGNVVVTANRPEPGPGDPAPASETPTLASANGDASKLTTRVPPDETLLRHSVAESLEAKVPFVVTFSTPEFCASRTCGPTVDVVEEVARRFKEREVRFIHVEVYEGNDPAKGYNRWMREWSLATEPWTFLVGADGTIVDRFEGPVSVRELEDTVNAVLAD